MRGRVAIITCHFGLFPSSGPFGDDEVEIMSVLLGYLTKWGLSLMRWRLNFLKNFGLLNGGDSRALTCAR